MDNVVNIADARRKKNIKLVDDLDEKVRACIDYNKNKSVYTKIQEALSKHGHISGAEAISTARRFKKEKKD